MQASTLEGDSSSNKILRYLPFAETLVILSTFDTPLVIMASSSSVDTPLVVEIKNCPCPEFKKYPFKSLLDDPLGEFSSVCHGALHTKEIRVYIHYDIEELGNYELSYVFTENLITNNQLKPEFAHLQRKGFTQFMDFLTFDKVKWV